jgi:hypothetical protein
VCWLQASSLQESSAELQGQMAELQSNLEAAQEALTNSRSAAAAQTARLAHLEGEFEALQVCALAISCILKRPSNGAIMLALPHCPTALITADKSY